MGCKCGSTTHSRSNHAECPLNKKSGVTEQNVSPVAPVELNCDLVPETTTFEADAGTAGVANTAAANTAAANTAAANTGATTARQKNGDRLTEEVWDVIPVATEYELVDEEPLLHQWQDTRTQKHFESVKERALKQLRSLRPDGKFDVLNVFDLICGDAAQSIFNWMEKGHNNGDLSKPSPRLSE